MYRKTYYDSEWSNKSNSNKPKDDKPIFEVGDKVNIKNSELDNSGIVTEVYGKNLFGYYEYYVEIRDNGKYCFENELEHFKGEY